MNKNLFFYLVAFVGFLTAGKVVAQSTTFNFTGSMQTYTVPTGCTSILVDVAGAQGGNYTSPVQTGGKGGRAQGTVAVTPGEIIYIYVGQQPPSGSCGSTAVVGGSNSGGGAQGGAGTVAGGCGGAGGGGSSDIRTISGTTTAALASRLLVGAGGGGSGYNCGENGGDGGGLTGANGNSCGSYNASNCGGPGTQTAGGAAGSLSSAGTFGAGGNAYPSYYGGGGGGGWYGAGGAYAGSGCGGSSFTGGTGVTGASMTAGFRTGNGYVVITNLTPSIFTSSSTLSLGGVTTGSCGGDISFTVSGANLTGAPGTLTMTAPANFQVSIDGTLWFSSLTLAYTSSALAAQTVFVRACPTALGALSGNITISGGGASSTTVAVSATGVNVCSAAPTAGTSASVPTSGGPSTSFTLSLSGTSVAGGLTYQWRSSPTGIAGSFTDIAGATNSTHTFSGLSGTTYFQCNVTCPSFGTVTSTNTMVTFVSPTYCTPTYGTTCGGLAMPTSIASLTGISSTSISDPSSSCGASGANYTDRYATMSVTLLSGTTYTASIGGNSYAGNYSAQIWIDFNDDGVFTSPGETIGGGIVSSTSTSGANSMTLTIPVGANPGTHRMRIVGNYSSCCGGVTFPGIPSCPTSSTGYGETRDYKVIIQAPCSTPAAITGTNYACVGGTTNLASATSGGTWSSSNTAVATVNASGVVSGVSAGAVRVTYTVTGGCFVTRIVGVYATPSVASMATSATTICANSTLTFTAGSTSGGVVSYTWSGPSSYSATTTGNSTTHVPASVASSGAYSVRVTSVAGCISNPASTSAITVLQSPAPFSGPHSVCEAASVTLGNSVAGGTWTSGLTGIATVAPTTGVVSGVSSGLANITYTLPNTCFLSEVVTVNPLPVVSVSPSGTTTICMGESVPFVATSPDPVFSLVNQDFNSGLSGWVITGSAAPANMWQIVTSATSADGTPGDGSNMLQSAAQGTLTNSTITSTSFNTMGYGSATLKFDQYLLSASPDAAATIQYSTDGGSSWTTLVEQAGTIVGSPSFTPGTPNTSITLPAGALGQSDVRLRWVYDASQYYWFLDNIKVDAQLPPSTFAWTGALGLSCTTCTSPTITPTSTGANNYSVTVTSSAGCSTTNSATVSVNPLPGSITGNLSPCVGTTFTLSNSTSGGTWSASNGNVTINSTTGAMLGVTAGNATITYTLPTGCYVTATATVAPAPAAIGGSTAVCTGQTVGLTHVVGGGTWASTNTSVATISSFGVVSGGTAGTTAITYTLPSGCVIGRTQTVNPTPAAISGTPVVCEGSTTNLSDATPGGVWSSNAPSIATINGLGTVTGASAGFALISYTISATGCRSTTTVTVNALPAAIGGATNVCVGSAAVVTNTTSGGTWSSAFPGIATVDASGLVTGGSAGNTVISYILSGTGCGVARLFTVNALPSTITGEDDICKDEMTGYTSGPTGGAWTSSNASTLSIDPSSGMATGLTAGNATITYTLPTTCSVTKSVTVNPLPQAISGTATVCSGSTTNLYNFTPGGLWISGDASVAAISPTGVVTGGTAGLASITYMLATTGCQQTQVVTVNPLPGSISGTFAVCAGNNTTLSSADFGGVWSSSNGSVATVNSATGEVTAVSAGNSTISYMLPTGCVTTQQITVNALPANITGAAAVCEGQTVNWSNATAGGNWTSDNSGIASVDASGVITGVSEGVTTITYTLPTSCYKTRNITVNNTPDAITGTASACVGQTSVLNSSTPGGVWSTGSAVTAPVNSAGVVSGGTAGATTISYTLPTGCRTTVPFVVNALPTAITGSLNVCEGSTTTLSSTTAVNWDASDISVATIDGTGVVTGVSAGTTTITCYTSAGCIRTATVNVNALPAVITGTQEVCEGSTTNVMSSPMGGTWSSNATGIATVSSAGLVIGVSNGNATITYTLPTTCRRTAEVTVNALPASITGTMTMCVGQSTTLSNGTGGGNWTSGNTAVASVNASGEVTGVSAGTSLISYTLSTGCQKTAVVTVNALPSSIVGNTTLCQGSTTLLGSATAGGSWSSSDAGVAIIGAGTGAVIGSNAGFSIITYTLPTGCYTTTSLVVNSLPEVITGTATVCAGSTTQLESLTGGGTWSSASSVATVSSTGVVTGVAAGTTTITYTTGNNCKRSTVVTVNALPNLISGSGSVCPGLSTTLSNANPGGVWTSDNTTVATIATSGATSGILSAIAEGTANITYTLPTGCMRSRMITVNAPVEPITGTLSTCTGQTTTLSNATDGGVWLSSNTSVATVNNTTGEVSGVSAGATLITYAMGTGCMSTATVIVNALPANITGGTAVCEGSTTMFANATAGGSWTSSDDAVATVSGTGVITGVSAGSATITYALGTGCAKTRTIEVNGLPVVFNVTGGGSYCSGGAGVAVGLDSSATGVNYTLMQGTTNVGTLAGTGSALNFGLKTGAGMYTVKATTGAGCVRMMGDAAAITITPLSTPVVSMVASTSDTVCAGTSVTYTATGSNGGTTPTYTWSIGTSAVGTGTTYTYTPADGDNVSVTFTSSAACPSVSSVSASKTMMVMPNLTPSVSISVGPNDTVCQGSAAGFTAVVVNGGTAPTYTWVVGGGIVAGATSSSYTYLPTNGQTVVCRVNSNYACPSTNNVSSNTITMRVATKYIPVVNIVAQPGTVIEQGQTVTFTTNVTGAGEAPTYQWLLRGNVIAGATTSSFTSSDLNDGDSVTCKVWGTGLCGLETINSVVMKVTPTTGVGTTSITMGDIRLVPNPNSGAFTVSGTLGSAADADLKLEITNMLGQVVYSGTAKARGGNLNERVELGSGLANGMYLLNISNGNDRKVFHFVLKQ
jgi:trimeric autotransporter adhesin